MKILNFKKSAVQIVVISAAVILLLVLAIIFHDSIIAFIKRLAVRLLNGFEYSYRFKIAYFSALVLLAGTFYLLFRTFLPKAASEKEQVTAVDQPIFNEKEKKLLLFAVIIIWIFWAPYLFQGQDIHVKIFDNLDSHVPHTKVLAESGYAFSLNPNTRLDNFLNGIALSGVDSGFNVLTWLFIIFPPFVAYALNDLLVRLVALLGMMLLLKKYIIKPREAGKTGDSSQHWLIIGAALCFALLPFYSGGGISIAGIPLLLYTFLNLLAHEKKLMNFLIIFIFPFYSKLALAGFFIVIVLFIIFVVDWLKKKKINFLYLGGLALLAVTYIFTHFHLVYSFIDPDFTSFREEIHTVIWSTAESIKRTIHNFLFDRVNVVGAQHIFVIGAAALAVAFSSVKIIKKEKVNPRYIRLLSIMVMAALLTSILWGFKYWKGIVPMREKFQVLNAFDLSRFYWFNPLLWYLIFALALLIISKMKYGKIIAAIFIVGQLVFMFVFYNWEYRHILGIKSSFAGSPLTYSLTYKEFYSESLFKKIQQHINRPQKDYRVVSLGIHPGISQYNGFYTLDIYTDVYSLEYKHQFRKIIEKELEKSEIIRKGFDGNAKRCFLLASELHGINKFRGLAFSRGITKKDQYLKLKNLNLNSDALKAMGGEYIFSAVEIVNYKENQLVFEGIFRNSESPWKIFLYRTR
jgi:ABC-type multidrug transport system fused ATPase/permease subunit